MSSEQGAGRSGLPRRPWLRRRAAAAGARGTNVPHGAATRKETEGKGSGSKENRPEGKGRPLEGSVSKPAGRSASTSRYCRPEGRGLPAPRAPSTSNAKARARAAGRHRAPAPPDQRRWGWHSKPDTGPAPLMAFPFGSQKRKTGSDGNF